MVSSPDCRTKPKYTLANKYFENVAAYKRIVSWWKTNLRVVKCTNNFTWNFLGCGEYFWSTRTIKVWLSAVHLAVRVSVKRPLASNAECPVAIVRHSPSLSIYQQWNEVKIFHRFGFSSSDTGEGEETARCWADRGLGCLHNWPCTVCPKDKQGPLGWREQGRVEQCPSQEFSPPRRCSDPQSNFDSTYSVHRK